MDAVASMCASVRETWYDKKQPTWHLPNFVSTSLVCIWSICSLAIWDRPILGSICFSCSFSFCSAATLCVVFILASYTRDLMPERNLNSSSFVFVTSTSITGCGAMFFPPPFLCHCCSCDVQAKEDCWSCSSIRSLVELQENNVNLHILNINANTWLQNPLFPATHEHEALSTSPDKMHKAIFRLCGGSFFRKLWQHFPLKKKYFESLAHSISSRYLSSNKCLAFTNPIGTVWWLILPMVFPGFNTWWFICSRVNIGIFSNDVPNPVVGNSAAAVLSLTSSELVPCFCFLRLYILCESGSVICLSLPLRMYSYTRFTSSAFVFKPFPVSPRHFSQNLTSEFFNSSGFRPSREALGISFSVRGIAFELLQSSNVLAIFSACGRARVVNNNRCDTGLSGLVFMLLEPGFARGPPLWKLCMT